MKISICNLWSINNAGRIGLNRRDTLHASRDTISSPERQATGDEISSTLVEDSLQIHLFMQNKANFRKVKLNVNEVLTRNYVQMDTWSIGKTKPIQSQFKANQSQSKPIKANIMPKQSQFKPKQTQFQSQYMKITGRHKPFAYESDPNGIDKTNCILSTNCVIISKYTRSNKMQLSEDCCPKFDEGAHICMEMK